MLFGHRQYERMKHDSTEREKVSPCRMNQSYLLLYFNLLDSKTKTRLKFLVKLDVKHQIRCIYRLKKLPVTSLPLQSSHQQKLLKLKLAGARVKQYLEMAGAGVER